jgi:hypothetical protein
MAFFAVNICWIWKHIGQENRIVPWCAVAMLCNTDGQKYLKIKNDVIAH